MDIQQFIARQVCAGNLQNIALQMVNLKGEPISRETEFAVNGGAVSFTLEANRVARGFRILFFNEAKDVIFTHEEKTFRLTPGETVSKSITFV